MFYPVLTRARSANGRKRRVEFSWSATLIDTNTIFFKNLSIPNQILNIYKRTFTFCCKNEWNDSKCFVWILDAIASGEMVRLAPSLKSQKGAIWTKAPTEFEWWEVDIVFRISGRGRIGADGMAFWYTTEQGDYNGNSFGSSDRWNGLGVLFDSFDNDNAHNNPVSFF